MRHFVVALDEAGSPIRNMDITTTDGEPKDSTEDHQEALTFCGMLNHYYEHGELLDGRVVGGYEVVSE